MTCTFSFAKHSTKSLARLTPIMIQANTPMLCVRKLGFRRMNRFPKTRDLRSGRVRVDLVPILQPLSSQPCETHGVLF